MFFRIHPNFKNQHQHQTSILRIHLLHYPNLRFDKKFFGNTELLVIRKTVYGCKQHWQGLNLTGANLHSWEFDYNWGLVKFVADSWAVQVSSVLANQFCSLFYEKLKLMDALVIDQLYAFIELYVIFLLVWMESINTVRLDKLECLLRSVILW